MPSAASARGNPAIPEEGKLRRRIQRLCGFAASHWPFVHMIFIQTFPPRCRVTTGPRRPQRSIVTRSRLQPSAPCKPSSTITQITQVHDSPKAPTNIKIRVGRPWAPYVLQMIVCVEALMLATIASSLRLQMLEGPYHNLDTTVGPEGLDKPSDSAA